MNKNVYNLEDLDEDESDEQPATTPPVEVVKKVNISRYHDKEGLSVSKMNIGLWYVEHHTKIKESIYFFFFVIALFSWFYFFYEFGMYVVKGIPADKLMIKQVKAQNLPELSYYSMRQPADLSLYPVKTITGTANKRDILAQINNPNKGHWARFKYYFLNNNDKIGKSEGFVLPGETKQLVSLGQDISDSIGGMRLVLSDIKWGRVNPHDFGVWNDFKESHLNFKVSNIAFAASNDSSLTEKLPLNTLSFHISNNNSYNYYDVPLLISLYNYSDLASVTTYNISEFESSENIEIDFILPGKFRKITNIEIVPNLDISRGDIYKEFKATKGDFR